MAFLDNSGDIILDAVLTDTGRMRLAKGDGTFRIAKFALGDDEIDYSLYDGNNSSGSAYFDLEILQTPVLEAFTNNMSSMKSKLISISRNNLLYLPVMKINKPMAPVVGNTSLVTDGYVLAVDEDTQDFLVNKNPTLTYGVVPAAVGTAGILKGEDVTNSQIISVAQGLDTEQILYTQTLDEDLKEVQYLIEIDNRFARIMNSAKPTEQATVSYIDDDNIATYYLSNINTDYVKNFDEGDDPTNDLSVLKGPRGTKLNFKLASQKDVSVSRYLFDQLGTDITALFGNDTEDVGNEVRSILTNIRITGITTGNSIDIPLLLIKKIS